MSITFGEARATLSEYAGVGGECPDSENAAKFVLEVLDYMLVSGQYGNIRKFCFIAQKGCFTAPPELETILKVRIDGQSSSAWGKWFEWHDTSILAGENCFSGASATYEEPNTYPTVYNLPSGGSRVGVLATCNESDGSYIIVKGKDPTGRQIITHHNGEQIVGEYLGLSKGTLKYTQNVFGTIDEIYKETTNGYVQLYWIKPDCNQKGFLADYSPLETNPKYKRYRLATLDPNTKAGTYTRVSVLGRIKLKSAYADTDLIPFDNRYTLKLAAQAMNAQYNNNIDVATAKDNTLREMIGRENEYKRTNNGQPIEVYKPTSAGSIQNIVGGSSILRWYK